MELFERAKEIRNESQDKMNTAWKVGGLLMDIIKYLGAFEKREDLPPCIDPNKIILYNGTLWRGLNAEETVYEEKTPWPVKGYKEIIIKTTTDINGDLATFNIEKDDNTFLNIEMVDNLFRLTTNVINADVFFVNGRCLNTNYAYVFNCRGDSTSNNIILGASMNITADLLVANFPNTVFLWNIRIYPPK